MLQHARHRRNSLALRRKIDRVLLCGLAVLAAVVLDTPIANAANAKSEYELRAAILYNLSRFVSWPSTAFATAEAPLVIGVLGRDPFGSHLSDALNGRTTAEGRPLLLIAPRSDADLARCHILFVTDQASTEDHERLAALGTAPVLTVGETIDFVQHRGGSMALILEKSKIRIYLNKAEADEAGLTVRAQLLRLCHLVEGDAAR